MLASGLHPCDHELPRMQFGPSRLPLTSRVTTIMAASMSLLGLRRLSVINAASRLVLNPVR